MANNFSAIEVALTNNTETTVISATANKQILIGLNVCNTGSSALTLDIDINDGSTDYKFAKGVSIPPSSKVEILRGKYVLGTGYSLKATSSATGGDCDIVVGLLTDVS